MKRRVPRLATDEEAEAFLESDLSDLDFLQFKSGRLRLEGRSDAARPSPHLHTSETASGRARRTEERASSTGRTAEGKQAVVSKAYRLFEQAMAERKQVLCDYDGYPRELCPIILGHSEGKEKALTYQFAGKGKKTLPEEAAWRCLFLHKLSNVRLREGPWYSGDSHTQPSSCVEVVDLDVNPNSPYNPKRRLPSASPTKPADPGRRRVAGRRSHKS